MSRLSGDLSVVASDLYADDSTQQHDLGAKVVTSDGRAFRYCKVGATALVPGKLYDGPAIVPNHVNIAVAAAAAAGATSVTVTLGATLASINQYAGGLLVVSDANGEGFTYQVIPRLPPRLV